MKDIDAELGAPHPELEKLPLPPGDILVLGAGGKMGLHLCLQWSRALARSGRSRRVLAVSRFQTLRGREEFESRGIDTIPCDMIDPGALARLPEAGIVYYLAGAKFGTSSSQDTLRISNVEMPKLVAERYRDSRIVALSTACVYPYVSPASGGSRESDPVGPLGAYAESCVGREKAFADASEKYGTPCVLVRLSYSCEYRYGVLADVGARVFHGEPVNLANGFANVIWQGDAIDMIARCFPLAASPSRALNLSGPDIVSIRWLAGEFGRRFGREVPFSGTESETAWLVNSAQVYRSLGRPATSLDEMIARTAAWIQGQGPTWGKPTKFEVRDGKF